MKTIFRQPLIILALVLMASAAFASEYIGHFNNSITKKAETVRARSVNTNFQPAAAGNIANNIANTVDTEDWDAIKRQLGHGHTGRRPK